VGVNGYGVSTRVYFSIPFDSVDYWVARLKGVGLNVGEPRLSIPLYGFYSIKPPVGGSMYMVWDLVFKLFALILHRFFPCYGWEFPLYTVRTQVYGYGIQG